MTNPRIAELLGMPVGTRAVVSGWVRTRRDSKAGLSFLHVSDGSCFDPLQVVAPGEMPGYQDVVLKIARGRRSSCGPTRSRWSAG
jgi:asparaginyl-tRNA synthetase